MIQNCRIQPDMAGEYKKVIKKRRRKKNKNMQAQPKESRTPTLDSYREVFKSIPESPEIRRFIWRKKKMIYINIAARPGAKIDKLLP